MARSLLSTVATIQRDAARAQAARSRSQTAAMRAAKRSHAAGGQEHANGDTGLELAANLLVALGVNRSTTTKSLLRAQNP